MKKTILLSILMFSLSVAYSCKKKSDPNPTVTNSYNDTSVAALKNSRWQIANQCLNITSPCSLDTSFFADRSSTSFLFYKFTNDSLFVSVTDPSNNFADTIVREKYLLTDFFNNQYLSRYWSSGPTSPLTHVKIITWKPTVMSIEVNSNRDTAHFVPQPCIWYFIKRK